MHKKEYKIPICFLVLILIFSNISTVVAVNSEDWNMYLKNKSHTSKAGDSVMPSLERIWTSDEGYFGYNSAVKFNDRVYIAEAVLGGKLYTFDLESGEIKWTYDIDVKGYPNKSPLVVDGIIYVGTSTGKLIAIKDNDTYGQLLWEYHVDGGITAGITYYNNNIYFTTDNGSIHSINLSGNKNWSYNICYNELSTPTIGDDSVYISSGNGYVYSLDISTGDIDWEKQIYNGYFQIDGDFSTSIIQDEKIFVSAPDGIISVLDSEDGKLEKRLHTREEIVGTIAADEEKIYAMTKEGNIYSFSIMEGNLVWKTDIKQNSGTMAVASPVISSNYLYVGKTNKDGKGELIVVNTDNGEVIENQELLSYGPSSPVVSNSHVIIGTQGHGLEVFKGKKVAESSNLAISSYIDKMLVGSETVIEAVYRNVYGEIQPIDIEFDINDITGQTSFNEDSYLLTAEEEGNVSVSATVYGMKDTKIVEIVDGDSIDEMIMLLNQDEIKEGEIIKPDFIAYDPDYNNVVIDKAYEIKVEDKSGKAEGLSNGNIKLIESGLVALRIVLPDTEKEFTFNLNIKNSSINDEPQEDKDKLPIVEDKKEINKKDRSQKSKTNLDNIDIDLNKINLLIKNADKHSEELTIKTDKNTVYLSNSIFEKLKEEGKKLVVNNDEIQFKIPPRLFKKNLNESNIEKLNFIINIKSNKEEYRELIEKEDSNYNAVGDIVEFEVGIAKDGEEIEEAFFEEPLEVSIKLLEENIKNIKPSLLGVYYINEETKKLEYMGGKYNPDDNTISFKTMHNSKYIVMEYKNDFHDLKNHWAEKEVEIMAAKHLVKGISKENFAPDNQITRAEFTTILVRMLGLEISNEYTERFNDIKEDDWYTPYILTANEAGLVNGYEDKFNPNENITRQEMAVMIHRVLKSIGYDAELDEINIDKFEDKSEIANWAADAASVMAGMEIIKGKDDTHFAPVDDASRAEGAVMLKRLLDFIQ